MNTSQALNGGMRQLMVGSKRDQQSTLFESLVLFTSQALASWNPRRLVVPWMSFSPYGIENVHVTGAALFPTAGSWNPTMTMCGYAQDLAYKLHEMKPQENEQRE